MQLTAKILENLFNSFCQQILIPVYGYGDEEFYKKVDPSGLECYGCNQFVVSEADYAVKLGGFWEAHLLPFGFTIHSELNDIYQDATRPDLSIHQTNPPGGIYSSREIMRGSVRAVVELKGANLKDPKYSFRKTDKDSVKADLVKLAAASPQWIRCMVILDEYPRDIPNAFDEEDERRIREAQILVLSNNHRLVRRH